MAAVEVTADAVADVLDKTSDEIMIRGWSRTTTQDHDGRVCTLGAMAYAIGLQISGYKVLVPGEVFDHPVCAAARHTLMAHADPVGPRSIAWWNSLCTEDEVHDALRNTAKAVRAGEIEVTA